MRYIGYNANGERVYKLTGQSILDQVNSASTKAQAIFDDAVLYPNPYVVVTSKGYTKHYYAGTERIATVIGTGGFDDMVTTIDKLSSPHDQNIVKTFYSDLENKYGKGSVVLSDVLTAKEFQQDWVAMSSQDIQEVNINHHGSNQAIHLDWQTKQYITSTGTGETRGGVPAINVSDLGFPSGNVSNATLNLNTCHSIVPAVGWVIYVSVIFVFPEQVQHWSEQKKLLCKVFETISSFTPYVVLLPV